MTMEQAIRAEAERSIYQDREGFYRSQLGGIGSMKHGCVLDWITTMLAEHIALNSAAERVRMATESEAVKPQASKPPAEKLDPCREVTQDEWLSIKSPSKAREYMSITECATCIVRSRVAEARTEKLRYALVDIKEIVFMAEEIDYLARKTLREHDGEKGEAK